jgi:hypothetical protein
MRAPLGASGVSVLAGYPRTTGFARLPALALIIGAPDQVPTYHSARLCRPAGKVIVSDLHPDAVAAGVQARFTDPATGDKHEMQSSHHALADYEAAAKSAGLRVRHTGEHVVDDALAARSDSARKYRGLPLLVVFDLAPA